MNRFLSITLAVLLCTIATGVEAQNAQWTTGQHVKVYYALPGGGGMAWRSGVIAQVFPWGVHMKFDDENREETFPNSELQSVDVAPRAAPAAPPAQRAASRPAPAPAAAGQACVSDPGVAQGGGTLTATIKHAIYENYAAEVNGGLSAPLAIGLTFQAFQIGAPLPNRVGPAGYEYPNAVRGTPVYPVATRHNYCRQYRNATNHTLFAGRYVCYQTRFGNGMECGTAEGHRLLGYQ